MAADPFYLHLASEPPSHQEAYSNPLSCWALELDVATLKTQANNFIISYNMKKHM